MPAVLLGRTECSCGCPRSYKAEGYLRLLRLAKSVSVAGVTKAEAATKPMCYKANVTGDVHVSVLAEEDAVSVSRFSVYMLLLHRPSLLGYLSIHR